MEISQEKYDELLKLAKDGIAAKNKLQEVNDLVAMYKVYFNVLAHALIGLTGAFGLNNKENTMIDEVYITKNEDIRKDPTSSIMKSIKDLMIDGMLAQSPTPGGRRKKEEMAKRFAFFKYLPVVTEFYIEQKKVKCIASAPLVAQFNEAVINGNFPETVIKDVIE